MLARFEKVPLASDRSFHLKELRLRRFDAPWHFHPEYELTLIVASHGLRFVGDSIEPFAAGDLVLLGPHLPHFWHTAETLPRRTWAQAVVVQFDRDFLGPQLWDKPEFAAIRRFLVRARRGLRFPGKGFDAVRHRLQLLPRLSGLAALTELLAVLDSLAKARAATPLATPGYEPDLDRRGEIRLARVYAFLTAHFCESLTLAQIAKVAAMTPAAFSRYFRQTTGRNVSDLLNDLRIGRATRQLRETSENVATIAWQCGFGTLSNFNRRFHERLKCAPREYRKYFATNAPYVTAPRRNATDLSTTIIFR